MDEPFSSLDALTREDSLDLVLCLWQKHTTTAVMVTHNMEYARRVDHAVRLSEGRLSNL